MKLFDKLVDEEIALDIVKGAIGTPVVAIDTETNGKDVRDGRGHAYGISIAYNDTAIYLPFRHREMPGQNYDLRLFLPYLQQVLDSSTIIYHNAKFDLVSLLTFGLSPLGKRFICTMVLAHLIDENRPFSGKGLDSCVKFYTDMEGKKSDGDYAAALAFFGYEGMDAEMTCEYAMWDAWITLKLYEKLAPLARKEKLEKVWLHKIKVIETLIAMEKNGVLVDQELCNEMAFKGHKRMMELKEGLGFLNPMAPTDLKVLLLDNLHLPIVKLSPTGKPSFDKFAMEEYEEILAVTKNKTAQDILEYRGWSKSVVSNYEAYLKFLSPDGRLRTNYNLHRTVTGRMSSNDPNLQQIPKSGAKVWNGKMKKCFIPKPGYKLIEGDYKQLQFRLSAAISKELVLIEAFNDPSRDVFSEMSKGLGKTRDESKTLTYTILFGGGPKRIKNVFGVDIDTGKRIRDDFFELYPNMLRAARNAQAYATSHKAVPIWSGRRRHFQNVKTEAHKAYNSIIQGGEADIVERTMVRSIEEGFNTDECRQLLQVHDSLLWEIREDKVDYYIPELRDMMERVTPDFGVKFAADFHEWGTS